MIIFTRMQETLGEETGAQGVTHVEILEVGTEGTLTGSLPVAPTEQEMHSQRESGHSMKKKNPVDRYGRVTKCSI